MSAFASGKVAALADRLTDAERTIDATGRLVLPGGIDAHCHLDQPRAQGLASGGAVMADDFESGSLSAVFGGTTTIIPFAVQHRGQSLRAAVADYHRRAAGKAYVDYAFHLVVSDPTAAVLGQELPALVEAGCTSLKVYMTYEAMRLSDTQILDVLARASELGALVMVHAENFECLTWLTGRLEAAGKIEPKYHATSRPMAVEREATHRAITLAEIADTAMLIVHVSGCEAADEIRRAKQTRAEHPRRDLSAVPAPDRSGSRSARFRRRKVHVQSAAARQGEPSGALARPARRAVRHPVVRPRAVPLRRAGQETARPSCAVPQGRERDPGARNARAVAVLGGRLEGRIDLEKFRRVQFDERGAHSTASIRAKVRSPSVRTRISRSGTPTRS